MRFLLPLVASLALSMGVAQAYEPGPPINLFTMTSEYNKGHYPMAHYIGCQLLQREPSNIQIHYLLGNCYVKFGQLDKAIAEYKFSAQLGQGSKIGSFSQAALEQITAIKNAPPGSAAGTIAGDAGNAASACPPEAGGPALTTATSTSAVAAPPSPVQDKMDLETLEYKERLLKAGADLIAANKSKLQKQMATVQEAATLAIQDVPEQIPGSYGRLGPNPNYASTKERIQNDAAARIRELQDNNEAEEQKITAYYRAQADSIGAQKSNLNSQTGHGDVRLVPQGTGLFVRNYVNYHGEVPLPPPPPELKAQALKLNPSPPPKKTKALSP